MPHSEECGKRTYYFLLHLIIIVFSNLCTLDFTAQCFRQFIYVLNDTRILIGSSGMLYMVLQFLSQSIARGITLCQNDGCFYNLTTDGIRCCCDCALQNGRVFDQCTFYFKWPNSIARALDYIIVSANKPIIAVFIRLEYIMRAIAAVVNGCSSYILLGSQNQTTD